MAHAAGRTLFIALLVGGESPVQKEQTSIQPGSPHQNRRLRCTREDHVAVARTSH